MESDVRSNRWSQIVAWIATGLFVSGFLVPFIGIWTSPILGVWFVGTQKPRRGFLWMLAIAFVPTLLFGWRQFPLTGPVAALQYLGWTLLAAVLSVLPFTFHRLVSPRLPGFLSTLPLPLAAVAVPWMAEILDPRAGSEPGLRTFLLLWLAAILLRLWNCESRATLPVFAGGLAVAAALQLSPLLGLAVSRVTPLPGAAGGGFCVGAALLAAVWALFHPLKTRTWAKRPETVARLRSPFTGSPLHVVAEKGHEALVSSSGERFPVRNGIPLFLAPGDLTGDNGKYNRLYETIGGFYDDTQRVACALKGLDVEDYFLAYMRKLEAKPGDAVLETSVGTGLNFKYLPQGVRLSGVDLAGDMLANCQQNLRRWGMDAELHQCNAESLPFADSTFDVVFHVGGISFFNDKGKAIREMIRVARPGSLLLISDETEEYARQTYEKIPYTSSFYKNRETQVTIPIDLVPPEMEEIRLEMIKGGLFYAITFRKPAAA